MSANVSRGLNISHNLCRGASGGDCTAAGFLLAVAGRETLERTFGGG